MKVIIPWEKGVSIPHGGLRTTKIWQELDDPFKSHHPTQWAQNDTQASNGMDKRKVSIPPSGLRTNTLLPSPSVLFGCHHPIRWA